MKQVTMGIVLILFTGFSLYAQQWTTSGTNIYNGNTGSVGIGITAPIAKLHIKGTGTTNSSSSLLIQNSAGTDLLKTFDNGFIGIGTTITPLEKLHIQNGDLLISSNANTLNTVVGALKFSYNSWPASYAGIAGMTNGGGLDQLDLLFYTAYGTATEKMRIMSNSGFVGIGTAAPGAKLDVNGNIFCNQKIAIGTTDLVKIGTNSLAVNGTAIFTKAKVAIYATAWPDYVFSPNYKLPSLAEIEDFIKYLNNSCYAGITGYEFNYSLYEKGSFYKKHLDQFQNNTSRQYSIISYLNSDWIEGDGGQLMIHQPNNNQTISPTQGKTVFFKSNELAHEVLVTQQRRMSITGWLKRD